MPLIMKEAKRNLLDFLQETVQVLRVVSLFYSHNMTQYNSFNVKLSNSKFNKLKSGIKICF